MRSSPRGTDDTAPRPREKKCNHCRPDHKCLAEGCRNGWRQTLRGREKCGPCEGTGNCPECKGSGFIRNTQ